MRYDWLLDPVAAEQPCGPDLDETGDDQYLDYVLTVGGRIPARFYVSDSFTDEKDVPIDRNAIKLRAEIDKIEGLLRQTRDLRLLCVEARFQSFAGDLTGFAETLEAIAGLTSRYWDSVHPQGIETGDPEAEGKDFTLRQNVLSGLNDWWQIVQPLQHLTLVDDKRLGVLTYRLYAVSTGALPKRPDDPALQTSEILRSLGDEDNREASDRSFAAIEAAINALASVRSSFVEHSGHDFLPSVDRLDDCLSKIADLFRAARPELVARAPSPNAISSTAEETSEAEAVPAIVTAAPVATGRIRDHAGASAALLAIEGYFAACEPSSPALILVHQARSLVGKSLVYALETLMPEIAVRVMIRFPTGADFKIPMPVMKSLTDKVALPDPAAPVSEAGVAYSASTREEAMSLLAEVEFFFKAAEPSSPIPMLLAKASGFTNWKFDMILKELISPVA